METYCMYLRKSRADAEAEARGEGETLSRHHRILLELAKRKGLKITAEYREIVSGDSIAARPQMQAMLQAVSEGKYTGVLCMEVERLARGNTIDQGVVAQAFKESGTLIITPVKTYDPDNEFDEEYFEFSLFMSRREYKTIKRRLQAGRLATIKEGCYISPTAPYGYRKIHPEPKIHTLEIVDEEAETVRMVYNAYLSGKGARWIAAELNRRGIRPMRSALWEPPSIKKILSNPIYAGFVQWHTKGSGDTCYQGLHPAIIAPEQFEQVQEKRRSNPAPQLPAESGLQNYYHGILYCGCCGHQMKRRWINCTGKAHMLCRYQGCETVSATVDSVDEAMFSALRYRISELRALAEQPSAAPPQDMSAPVTRAEQELARIKQQQNRLYDFLEQGVYDTSTFLDRMQLLNEKKAAAENRLAALKAAAKVTKRSPADSIVQLQRVLDRFRSADTEEKNRLLHTIVNRITYHKSTRACYRNPHTDLQLDMDFI